MPLLVVVVALAFVAWAFARGGDGSKTAAMGLVFVLLVVGPIMVLIGNSQRHGTVTALTTDPRDGVTAIRVDCGSVRRPLTRTVSCETKLDGRRSSSNMLIGAGVIATAGSLVALSYALYATREMKRRRAAAAATERSEDRGADGTPAGTTPAPPSIDSSFPPDRRACPYCAESIKKDAVLCRYCNRDVEPV